MKRIRSHRHLWMPLLLASAPLWAQTPVETASAEPPPAATQSPTTRVGDATQRLLHRQRAGLDASSTPRPIDGAIAAMSRERHLKSFQQPLPQWFGSKLEGARQ